MWRWFRRKGRQAKQKLCERPSGLQAGGRLSQCLYDHSTRRLHTFSSNALRGILFTHDGSRGLLAAAVPALALSALPLVAEAVAIVAGSEQLRCLHPPKALPPCSRHLQLPGSADEPARHAPSTPLPLPLH